MKSGNYCMIIFYSLLHIMTFLSIFTFSDFIHRYSLAFQAILISSCGISIYLFAVIRKDPGIITKYKNLDTEETNSNIYKTINADLLVNCSINNSNLIISTEQDTIVNDKTRINKIPLEESFPEIFDKKCDKCDPLRGKHCSRCGICVRKFDHHCSIVGGCIGEKNHFKFFIYLLTQSIALVSSIYILFDTISDYLERRGEKYSQVPIILFILVILLIAYALFTIVLSVFHTYLIATNQTTYEIYHKSKMPYIIKYIELKKQNYEKINKTIPSSLPFHPFDLGIIENIKLFYYNKFQQ